jgi:hypothetical protein
MRLPADAIIAAEKVTRYLLVSQTRGDKSAFLARGGYTIENADQLLHDLRSILNQRKCVWCHQIHYPNSGELTHRAL